MLTKINFRYLFFFLVALLVFTQGLIFFHYSGLTKSEYDGICHGLYDEKVWIDTCYFPYEAEIKTFELARNIEIAGLILLLTLFFLKDKLSYGDHFRRY